MTKSDLWGGPIKNARIHIIFGLLIILLIACSSDSIIEPTPQPASPPPIPQAPANLSAVPTLAPIDLASAGGAEAVGALISQDNGCITCHSIDGSDLIGPSWKGLWGKTEQLENGSSVTVDENYIKESIIQPSGKIVKGYPAVMPAFTDLSEDELTALVAYIKSLD